MRILFADPNEALLEEYAHYFSANGAQVATAADGLQCVSALRRFRPHVLVLEPEIPWGGGAGVLERMHQEYDLPYVPVIVLTAARDKDEHNRVMQFPVKQFIAKPLSAVQLHRRILDVDSEN